MNVEFKVYSNIFNEIEDLINKHFEDINNVIYDSELHKIFDDYNKNLIEHKNAEFNIFNLLSDKYYYENLHSDIISVFLDKNGKHEESNKFLKIFIELLQKIKPELDLNNDDFNNPKIYREKFKIDILIQDQSSQKAIIIENKINNAVDMVKQLPRYVKDIGNDKVVAIVYLPLNPNKDPDDTDWETEDKTFIASKFVNLPAFNRTKNDLYEGWLLPCIEKSKNEDVKLIIKQYSKLIQKIGGFIMDNKLHAEFYKKVIETKGFWETANSIKCFIEELHLYRAQRVYDVFINDYSPFEKLIKNGPHVIFDGYKNGVRAFKFDILFQIDKYELRFWDSKFNENINGEQVNIKFVSKINELLNKSKFKEHRTEEFVKFILFPGEEDYLYEFIFEFKNELKKVVDLNFSM